MKRSLLALALLVSTSVSIYAADSSKKGAANWSYQLPKKIVMPGGEVYKNPEVVNVKPDGVTIMHQDGVAFWPFSQLPEAIRKKFHYNPAKAVKYHDKMVLRRKKLLENKRLKEIKDAHESVYVNLVSQRYYVHSLELKIDKIERQIKWDQQRVSRDNSFVKQDRNDIANIGENTGSTTSEGPFWTQSSQDTSSKMHVVGDFQSDWQKNEADYEGWRFGEKGEKDNLATYKDELKEAKAKLKKLEAEWAKIKKNDTKVSEDKLKAKIYQNVNKEVNDDMIKLEELAKMRDKKLISPQEYIKKKAQILKSM